MSQPPKAALALLLGWGGAELKNLRPYARMHREVGADVLTHVPQVLSRIWRPARIVADAVRVHDAVVAQLAEGQPLVIHSFSDNGFLALGALLAHGAAARSSLASRTQAVLVDSAPGVYALRSARELGDAFGRALAPLLARRHLRRPDLPRGATRALGLGFAAYFAVRPAVTRPMQRSAATAMECWPLVTTTLAYGDGDAIIPKASVERFADWLAARRVPVRRELFEGSGHVTHLLADRRRYERIVRSLHGDAEARAPDERGCIVELR